MSNDNAASEPNQLPREIDDAANMRAVVLTLAAHRASGSGYPLWSVVSDLLGCGSTVAMRVCRRFGHDPELNVIKPGWFDPEKTCIRGYCHTHSVYYDLENESCEECEEADNVFYEQDKDKGG